MAAASPQYTATRPRGKTAVGECASRGLVEGKQIKRAQGKDGCVAPLCVLEVGEEAARQHQCCRRARRSIMRATVLQAGAADSISSVPASLHSARRKRKEEEEEEGGGGGRQALLFFKSHGEQ
jgi:hypothetical protein